MKQVLATIKATKLDDVCEALVGLGISEVVVTEAKVYGRQKGKPEFYRGAGYASPYVHRLEVKVVIEDDKCDQVVEAIQNAAFTSRKGTGRIIVTSVEHLLRIRTGEANEDAI